MAIPVPSIPGYTLQRPIGRGGFGIVFAATPEGGGDTVAVKVLTRVLDDDAAQRFVDEVQVMGTLAWHPNIVRILGAGVAEGQPWIAMELLTGGSVGDVLDTAGPLGWQEVSTIGVQAATGLQVAHNAGLLHRDVKPDNLLRTAAGTVKVSDFGVAAAAGGPGAGRGTTGTIAYSAPELLNGAPPSVASDVYALGASLYAMLAGAPAFHRDTDESPAAMILRAYRDPVPDVAALGVPAPLARVVQRAMAKDPAERPRDAAALLAELQGARRELGLEAVATIAPGAPVAAAPAAAGVGRGLPDQPPAEARARAQRLQRVLGGIGAAAAVLVAVTFVATSSFTGGGGDADSAGAPPQEDSVADEAPVDDLPVEDLPPQEAEEEPPVGAGDPVIVPSEAAPPPPAPPPPPPVPDLPATGPQVITVTGLDDVVWQVRADAIRRDPQDGGLGQTVTVTGAADVAIAGQTVAVAVTDGPVQLLDAGDLSIAGQVDVVATEVVTAANGFWAATADGITAFTPDGTVTTTVPVPDVVAIAAAPDGSVVWGVTAVGDLLAVDTADGSILTRAPVGEVAELAVDADGDALVVDLDGGVQEVSATDGTVAPVAAPDLVADVAVTLDGSRWVVADGQLWTAPVGSGFTPVALDEAVELIEPGGAVIWVVLADDTVISQPG